MQHFDNEHQALQEVRGVTMRSTAFHANAVSNEVLEEVRGMNETVQQVMMMMQMNQSPPSAQPQVTQEYANFTPSNSHEVSSEILPFL